MTICERIFLLLERQGKRQSDFAKCIGVRPATITDWKMKRTSPSSDLIAPIAEYFGVSCDYLCTGKEYDAPSSVQQGIFGDKNNNNSVIIDATNLSSLSEFERELVRICGTLDIRRKNALLTYAYELEK